MLSTVSFSDRVSRAAHFIILCGGLLAFFPASVIAASSVALAWDPSPGTNIAGYKIYYGVTSHTYTNTINVGNGTNTAVSNLVSGAIYYFAATAYDASALESDYSTEAVYTNVTATPPTIVLGSPANGASYAAPATINLAASVTANGHTITQVRFYNGATLLGADASAPYSFAWTSVDAGSYSLTARAVYDSGSTVASAVANVTVGSPRPENTPPAISAIADQTMATNTAPLSLSFTVNDAETAAADLTLHASSTNPLLVPTNNIVFDGSDSNRTVTLTPLLGQIGEATITITVSDGDLSASSSFNLMVAADAQAVAAVALVSPSGSLAATSTLRYDWKSDPAATWYELYVTSNGVACCDKWFAATNLVVDPAKGTVGVDVVGQGGGMYQWYVRGWSAKGLGPWSSAGKFSVAVPGQVALIAPANNATLPTRLPQLGWTQSFPAATWYRLYVTRNQHKYLDQWVPGAANFTPTAELPGGSYSWWVQTYNQFGLGPWSTNASFTVPVVVPGAVALVPLAGGGTVQPNLKQLYTWKTVAAATWYQLYIVQNGKVLCDKWFTASNSVAQSGSGNFAVVIGGHIGGSYKWWVRGWSVDGTGPWSAAGSYTMDTVPAPGAVTLLTPANNATGQIRQPVFRWTASNPEASWYYVNLERNGKKCLDQWVEASTTNWVPSAGLAGGNYSWRILPWSEAGYGPWSTTYSFTVPTAVPGALTVLSPAGSLVTGATQRYLWRLDPAATWYELLITRNGHKFSDQWLASGSSAVSSATGNFAVDVAEHGSGAYQFWVRGWSPDGLGPWSSAGSFSMDIPGPVTLLTPTNTASIQDRRPEFSWSQPAPAASWFHLNLSHNGTNYLQEWIEGTTNWTPTVDLPGGTYTWAIQGWNPSGLGAWSENATFTNQYAVPTSIVLLSPEGPVPANATQRYLWKADPAATWYQLYITRNGGVFCDQWYASTNSVVDGATGNVGVDVNGLGSGTYQWTVRGYSADGLGPWSDSLTFRE